MLGCHPFHMQPMNFFTRGDVFTRMITNTLCVQPFPTPDTHPCRCRSAGLLLACIFISVLFASPSLSAKLGRFFRTGSTLPPPPSLVIWTRPTNPSTILDTTFKILYRPGHDQELRESRRNARKRMSTSRGGGSEASKCWKGVETLQPRCLHTIPTTKPEP